MEAQTSAGRPATEPAQPEAQTRQETQGREEGGSCQEARQGESWLHLQERPKSFIGLDQATEWQPHTASGLLCLPGIHRCWKFGGRHQTLL